MVPDTLYVSPWDDGCVAHLVIFTSKPHVGHCGTTTLSFLTGMQHCSLRALIITQPFTGKYEPATPLNDAYHGGSFNIWLTKVWSTELWGISPFDLWRNTLCRVVVVEVHYQLSFRWSRIGCELRNKNEKYHKRKISDTYHILEMWVYCDYICRSTFGICMSIRGVASPQSR